MTSLTLKRASASRPDGQWSENDFDVLADGTVVGRILESGSRFDPPGLQWTWSILITPATPGQTKRHRRYARRGDGEVSGGMGAGEGGRLKAGLTAAAATLVPSNCPMHLPVPLTTNSLLLRLNQECRQRRAFLRVLGLHSLIPTLRGLIRGLPHGMWSCS
jgi:hypothetical protein